MNTKTSKVNYLSLKIIIFYKKKRETQIIRGENPEKFRSANNVKYTPNYRNTYTHASHFKTEVIFTVNENKI